MNKAELNQEADYSFGYETYSMYRSINKYSATLVERNPGRSNNNQVGKTISGFQALRLKELSDKEEIDGRN